MTGLKNLLEIPKHIGKMLDVHYDLWDFRSIIEVNGVNYSTRLASHGGYNSVLIPGKDNLNYLWMTQNLNKSTSATTSIEKARQKGENRKITWIINSNDGHFTYVGRVTTHFYPKSDQSFIEVIKFTSSQEEVLYRFDPNSINDESIYS